MLDISNQTDPSASIKATSFAAVRDLKTFSSYASAESDASLL